MCATLLPLPPSHLCILHLSPYSMTLFLQYPASNLTNHTTQHDTQTASCAQVQTVMCLATALLPSSPPFFFFVIDSPLLLPYLTTPRLVLVEKQSFYSTLFFLGFHSILWPSFYWARLAVVESKSLNLHLSPRSKFGFRCQKNSHSLLKSKIEEYKMENLSWRCVRWRQIRT